jgi:hypothetical protein
MLVLASLVVLVAAQAVDFSKWGSGFDDGRDHGCGGYVVLSLFLLFFWLTAPARVPCTRRAAGRIPCAPPLSRRACLSRTWTVCSLKQAGLIRRSRCACATHPATLLPTPCAPAVPDRRPASGRPQMMRPPHRNRETPVRCRRPVRRRTAPRVPSERSSSATTFSARGTPAAPSVPPRRPALIAREPSNTEDWRASRALPLKVNRFTRHGTRAAASAATPVPLQRRSPPWSMSACPATIENTTTRRNKTFYVHLAALSLISLLRRTLEVWAGHFMSVVWHSPSNGFSTACPSGSCARTCSAMPSLGQSSTRLVARLQ